MKQLLRYPLNGTFELTARCNLNCKMCLIRIDNNRMRELGGRERTAKEWIDMAKEVWNAGTMTLLLTGGEPMLRPDFIEIYEEIAKMGFILTLYTNATLITPEIMKSLSKYPPHEIAVTIYGASSETYEKVTGSAKAYDKMLTGVKALMTLPSKISLRSTIIKDNRNDLEKITELANGLGPKVDFSISKVVTKAVRGGVADVEPYRLTPEENVAMLEERKLCSIVNPMLEYVAKEKEAPGQNTLYKVDDNRNKTSSAVYDEDNLKYKGDDMLYEEKELVEKHRFFGKKDQEQNSLYGCGAGDNSYTITWDGKLIGCQMLGDCCTYPFHVGFEKAWEEFPSVVKLPPIPEECIGCDVFCCACPATRLAETGSLGGFSEYLCKESKLESRMNHKLIGLMKNIL